MKSNDFVPKEVLASGNTGRDRERHLSFICNEAIDTPLLRRVHAILVYLEPLESGDAALGGTGNLCAAP